MRAHGTDLSHHVLPVGDRHHWRGPVAALATLVELGDFECPAAFPIVEAVRLQLSERPRSVFRHFPLSQIRPHASATAKATGAAGAQR